MYKIISNDTVIDVVEHPKYTRFLSSGHVALTDKTSAHGIIGSDNWTIYSFVTNDRFQVVTVEEINSTDEFNRLKSLLNSGQVVYANESALANARRKKIDTLSDTCKNRIVSGFTIRLSNDELYNFRLTTEDQLNLTQIESQIAAGESNFVYHATNQPCKIYGKEDMSKIVKAFRKHVLYHTTYFNVAKQHINALTDIEEINLFTYGKDVSESVRNPALKQILINGGA